MGYGNQDARAFDAEPVGRNPLHPSGERRLGGAMMGARPRVLVSLCLLGAACRYDGKGNQVDLRELMARAELIPLCPEQLGGLPTPRVPAERRGDRVVTRDGRDVTGAFERGAKQAAMLAERFGIGYALMKARSPSCGFGVIYDGTFTGRLTVGMGVTAMALYHAGIQIFDEAHIDELIRALDAERME